MPGRGKLVIALMLLLGFALGGYAWWVQLQKGRRVLNHWGPRATYLIRHGERVELLRLGETASGSLSEQASTLQTSTLSIGGRGVPIEDSRDITDVPGLVHARHSLIVDSYYQWGSGPGEDCTPDWEFALRFSTSRPDNSPDGVNSDDTATLVFAPNCQLVYLLEMDRQLPLLPGLSDTLAERAQRWFEQAVPR